MVEEFLPVRLSHLLRHCSVGAIVRGSDSLMVVRDIRDWNPPGESPRDREIRHVDQVRSALGISQALCRPPVKREQDGIVLGWIPAERFPSWMRCLQCGLMHRTPWRSPEVREMKDLRCIGNGGTCEGRLEQSPWVLVHENGYLADAPWHDLAHADSRHPKQRQCQADWTSHYLKLVNTEAGRRIQCTRCQSSGGLESRWPFGIYTRQQPWIDEPPAEPAKDPAWLLEINDVRVHSTVTRTALVIPPESRIRKGTVVDQLYGNSRYQQAIRNARTTLAKKSTVRRVASDYGCSPDEIEEAMEELDRGYPLYGQSITQQDLLVGEYLALTEPIPNLKEDEDFVTSHQTSAWKALGRRLEDGWVRRAAASVDRLIAVNKLKEIMVLTGFRRAGGEDTTPPDITGDSDWRPAVELYGEGLFFTLDESLLKRWEDNPTVRERTSSFKQRYPAAPVRLNPEVDISSRFLLCHTLAHLMIRQIEATAGYPAASLKERIYCASGAKPMAGILIYVAVADEEGSLGGVMELATPDRFLRLLTAAYEAAEWCSLDPVCSEQEGHGPGLLNRAACHACALVPETSCLYENVLLDRAFVKGDAGFPAFLDMADA